MPRTTPAAPPAAAASLPGTCLNCGEAFAERGERRPRCCPACGQETTQRAPTVGEFLQQFGGAYFATEGALWRSLKLLLLKPGALTAQYLAGRRKHHGLPLRLYLALNLGSGRAGMKDGVFFCERLPTWVCRRIQRRVDIDPRRMLGAIDALKDCFLGHLGSAMFVLLPGFALWLKLAYRNRACTASSAG